MSGRGAGQTIYGFLFFLLAAVLLSSADAAHAAARGAVERYSMEAPSVGEKSRTVRVYLPPSYPTPEAARRRYPVVYMLHGWPGSDGNLLSMGHAPETADSLIARGGIPEVLLVFPNGGGEGALGRSYWLNSYDGRKRVEDYVTRDLIAWVDARFRTIANPSGRGLIGISEGGDAALNLAFKHPELFSACGGHSGDYVLSEGFGTRAFLGPEPGAKGILADNSPALYADLIVAQLERQTIYFDCGTADESLENNRRFHQKLVALKVPHVYNEFPGTHTWGYWSAHLRESLLVVAGALH